MASNTIKNQGIAAAPFLILISSVLFGILGGLVGFNEGFSITHIAIFSVIGMLFIPSSLLLIGVTLLCIVVFFACKAFIASFSVQQKSNNKI